MFEDIDLMTTVRAALDVTLLLLLGAALRGQMRSRQVMSAQMDRLSAALKATRRRNPTADNGLCGCAEDRRGRRGDDRT